MKLKVIGSGSSGNCYLLESEQGGRLMIELGVVFEEIKQALDSNYDNLLALVSHRHGDHAKAIKQAVKAGIPVASNKDTFEANGLNTSHYCTILEGSKNKIEANGFTVRSFPLVHDVPCSGFLIDHEESGLICFITDTQSAKNEDEEFYIFPKIKHFIVEANFCESIVLSHVYDAHLPLDRANRVVNSHCSIQECINILEMQDLSECETITLIHLSDRNSNEAEFIKKVVRKTGIPTFAASKNLEITLDK